MSQLIGNKVNQEKRISYFLEAWLPTMAWGVAVAMVAFLLLVFFFNPQEIKTTIAQIESSQNSSLPMTAMSVNTDATLPQLVPEINVNSLVRSANPRTIIASQPRREVTTYIVETKDSMFGIANKFKLKPETILWANFDELEGNADMLIPGMELNIPPVDGVYYQWQEGDTLESVAEEFKVTPENILLYSPNRLDITNPVIQPETYIMIPDGKREIVQQWIIPLVARGSSGVLTNVIGPGGCSIPDGGAYGTGTFMYPTNETRTSGNDFWSGHLGIDLAVGMGDLVRASDGGVIIYAGWGSGGYGNMVMIDHGTGYQTLYAHLSSVAVSCGQSVGQGSIIGYGGSTGNSTGPHLHFEVRFMGGFVNPWYVLP